MMLVRDVMNVDFLSIGPDVSLHVAAAQMLAGGEDTLLVVAADELLGVIGIRDLFTAPRVAYRNLAMPVRQDEDELSQVWQRTLVRNVMSESLLTVSPDTSLMKAARMLSDYGKHLLPVLDQGRIVATLSRRDVLRAILQAGVAAEVHGENWVG